MQVRRVDSEPPRLAAAFAIRAPSLSPCSPTRALIDDDDSESPGDCQGPQGNPASARQPKTDPTMIRRVLARAAATGVTSRGTRRAFSDNVTYSGGQAGVQGGFYGAGGARSQASPL